MLAQNIILSALPAVSNKLFIAYSGGVDSHVLLHLASSISELKAKIVAVYVHHGLQQEADNWAEHCEKAALALGVKFKCLKVNAQKGNGLSPEEAAREVRYTALKALLVKNDVLLLAQHREDQVETVLLQLFRGAGIKGLSGMPAANKFGAGIMCRPFVDVSKQDINQYAQLNQLNWVEDPSNKSNNFDRNFLRNQILPQLKQRWPGLDKTVSRSAKHCANTQIVIQELANEWLNCILDKSDQTLNIPGLLELEVNKQHLVLREWFNSQRLRMPSKNTLDKILNEIVMAKKSANPQVQGKEFCIRRYKEKLFCLKIQSIIESPTEKKWPADLKQLQLDDGRILMLAAASEGISKVLWDKSEVSIKFRKGAEKIRLPGRNCHHTLKKLFQDKALPPWERSMIPLIYLDNELAAVSDLWISADFFSADKEECYQIIYLNGVQLS